MFLLFLLSTMQFVVLYHSVQQNRIV